MPTLKSGNGALENGSSEVSQSPGFLSSTMKRAGAILGIISATVATDTVAQQAPNNLVPKVPALVAPAAPGVIEDTSQIPTGADVVSILQNGKDKIRSKFSTFNDAVFARIVGEISLGSIKPETLDALAGAFPEGSEERKSILVFSNNIKTGKYKLAVTKKTPMNETPEEKKKRLEEERLSKVRRGILDDMNKEVLNPDKWKSVPIGNDGNDSAVKGKRSNGGVVFSINGNASKGQSTYIKQLPPGKYTIKTKASDGKIGVWWKGGTEITLTSGSLSHFEISETTDVNVYVKPNSITPQITIHEFSISETPEEVKIAQQGAQ